MSTSTRKSRDIGQLGEAAAVAYLESHGYTIIERNYRSRRGEIDIVCSDAECLVFVEVKSVGASTDWYPGDRIDTRKQRKLILTAQSYLLEHQQKSKSIRFDAMLMTKSTGGNWSIEHVIDAFRPDENDHANS